MHADDTTLGADNGMGGAMILAVLEDKNQQHGPLQVCSQLTKKQVWMVLQR